MGYRLRTIYILIPLFVLLFVPAALPAYESGLAENARSPIPPPSLKAVSYTHLTLPTKRIV